MVKHLERSLVMRRWLAVAVAFLLSAGVWAVGAHRASAATTVVSMTNFTFTPPDITINVGDTVTWVNDDAESHAPEGGSFSSPEVRAGESFSHTFTAPEQLTYICRFHTYITGTINVVAPGAPEPTVPPTTAPPTTVAPTVAPDTPTTPTTAPPVVRPPTGTRGAGFQEVPDDPSARKPPAEAGPSKVSTIDPTTSDTPPSSSATTAPSSGGTGAGSAPSSGGSTSFQEVPHDPSAAHPAVELLAASTDEGEPPTGGSPPAPLPGSDLGDGTVLAPFTRDDNVKVFNLSMAETSIEVSPGVVKQAYAFNGIVPGPVLRVNEGDRVRIVVDNKLPFPTATHWHGMILPNDQDGVGGITQADIPPGGQYVYEWTAVATGTHWYHAHSSGRHIGKGLFGVLEVVPDEDDFEADRDYRLMIGDTDLGFTLNGRSFPSTPTLEAAVGETVRLRLVNTGDQVHAMHLHGVPFKVVAQDGIPKEQVEQMDTLTISPGQTFDLLFTQRYPGKWVIHCHMFVHSHMTGDVHPPGESGMNGITTILNVTGPADAEADGADGAAAGDPAVLDLDDVLPTSGVGRSDISVVSLLAIGALLLYGARRRIRTHLPTPKS